MAAPSRSCSDADLFSWAAREALFAAEIYGLADDVLVMDDEGVRVERMTNRESNRLGFIALRVSLAELRCDERAWKRRLPDLLLGLANPLAVGM